MLKSKEGHCGTEEAQVSHASVLPRAMNKQHRVGENSKQGRRFWNVYMISSIHGLSDWAIDNQSAACFQEPSGATWRGCSPARPLLQLLNIVCEVTVVPFGNFTEDKDGEQETFYSFCGKTEPPFSSGDSQWDLRGAQLSYMHPPATSTHVSWPLRHFLKLKASNHGDKICKLIGSTCGWCTFICLWSYWSCPLCLSCHPTVYTLIRSSLLPYWWCHKEVIGRRNHY